MLLAKLAFENLAGRIPRQRLRKNHRVGQLPSRNLALVNRQYVLRTRLLALRQHHDENGAFVPFGMRHTDDRGIRHRRHTMATAKMGTM